MSWLRDKRSYIVGAVVMILGILVLAGLSIQALSGVAMILGGAGLIALRLAIKKEGSKAGVWERFVSWAREQGYYEEEDYDG